MHYYAVLSPSYVLPFAPRGRSDLIISKYRILCHSAASCAERFEPRGSPYTQDSLLLERFQKSRRGKTRETQERQRSRGSRLLQGHWHNVSVSQACTAVIGQIKKRKKEKGKKAINNIHYLLIYYYFTARDLVGFLFDTKSLSFTVICR